MEMIQKIVTEYGPKFPARQLKTKLVWDDLIVSLEVLENLNEISSWIKNSELILEEWGLEKILNKGYRSLFYGPPGTGKTLAAALLGKRTNRPVYSINLSIMVSKYIGETEENLGKLFDIAEEKDWILFFDEADALFGRRTQSKGANDRYANQEVSYLLQRIEDFNGVVILSTSMMTNIDDAFMRRFQSMVYFRKPDVEERKKLWNKLFAENFELDKDIDLNTLAEDYEITGGEMIHVLRYCALEAAKREERTLQLKDIITGIRREYQKLNKTI